MLITLCLAILFQFVKPMPPMENEAPAEEYGGSLPSSIAISKVYCWLPADKQPKKLVNIKAAPPPPPANYDIKKVASEAAESVYSWLPKEQQPKLMDTKMSKLSGQKRKFTDDMSDYKHKKIVN